MIKNKSVSAAEDPTLKAAREREQARVEASRTAETQLGLQSDTVKRLRRFGKAAGPAAAVGAASGSVPLIAPASPGGGGLTGAFGSSALGLGKLNDMAFERAIY